MFQQAKQTEQTKEELKTLPEEFGTECMRVGFFDGIWVSLTKQHLIQNKDKNFVITDVRFPNEAKMILEAGGQVWLSLIHI